MKNLGKIILTFILITIPIFALEAKISPKTVYEGDQVSFIITAQGDEIKFPKKERIAGYKVTSQSISRNISNINGKVTKTLSKEYLFTPQNDFIIPPIEVFIDGKTLQTKKIKVKLQKEKRGDKEAFIFELSTDKSEVYMGEPINVLFTFKKHLSIDMAEANFNAPNFNNFWAKPTPKIPAEIEGEYMVYKIRYLIFPQKSGNITIDSGRMDAGIMQKRSRDFFSFERVKWKSLFSNNLTVKVNPLPQGVDIYGNFKLDAKVDKLKTKANEPVNLTITIKGVGNIDDIEPYKLDIKDAIVYADKPEKKVYTNNKEELGEFTQKFAIVSDRNFTINPLEFKFFDSNDKEVKLLISREFKIEVEQSMIKTQTAKLEKSDNTPKIVETKIVYDKASKTKLILFTIGGFLAGVLSAFLLKYPWKKREVDELPLARKVKNSKSDKALLSLLLPYSNKSKKMKNLVRELEENIYEGKRNIIDRADLIKNIENYLLKEKDVEDILR